MIPYFFLLVGSGVLLFIAANQIVRGIIFIARYLQWQEFVIAFFVMAIASSIPNLFVGISSALHGIPELSFGDVMGNSVIDLTLVMALAGIIGKHMSVPSNTVQVSSLITSVVAVLPILLIMDGSLGRGDAAVLLFVFFFYSFWLFSKRKTHPEIFNHHPAEEQPVKNFKRFFFMISQIAGGVFLMFLSAEGVVRAAKYFADSFELPIPLIGILVIGMGSALPELYFGIAAARRGRYRVVLGEMMGSVIVISTFVLGVVALIEPIVISDFSPFAIARVFLVVSALFFFLFVRSDRKVTLGEASILLALYVIFVLTEIFRHAILPFIGLTP
ncbi:MAG: sodium:calcium antiporter [Parcubacteria group bacterium]|nr:sodium:calcium antiporter [Parcubacteria group bacterium]